MKKVVTEYLNQRDKINKTKHEYSKVNNMCVDCECYLQHECAGLQPLSVYTGCIYRRINSSDKGNA